jgi:hypothetical protein
MFGFKLPVKVEALEVKAEAVANVLNDFKVFGDVEGKWLESQVRGFKHMVISHAKGEGYAGYLELTYPSCVRLLLSTEVVGREAVFSYVEAYDHPWKNDQMDYEGLNKAIQEVLTK